MLNKNEKKLRKVKQLNKDEKYIPPGFYCYMFLTEPDYEDGGSMKTLPCPYLEFRKDKPSQMFGYCHFLELGDWEDDGTSLLWDMVKECSVNCEEEWYNAEDFPTDLVYQKEIEWLEIMLPLIDDAERKNLVEQKIKEVKCLLAGKG